MTLEAKIKSLETLIRELESEEVDLDQAIQHYGDAVKLSAQLIKSLQKLEEKLIIIQKDADAIAS